MKVEITNAAAWMRTNQYAPQLAVRYPSKRHKQRGEMIGKQIPTSPGNRRPYSHAVDLGERRNDEPQVKCPGREPIDTPYHIRPEETRCSHCGNCRDELSGYGQARCSSSRRLKDPSCAPVYKDAIFHGTRGRGEAGRRSQLFVIVADRSSEVIGSLKQIVRPQLGTCRH